LRRYGDDVDQPIDAIAQREISLLGPGMTVDGVLDTVRRLSAAHDQRAASVRSCVSTLVRIAEYPNLLHVHPR
jgi:hypothetical protein